MRGDYSFVKCVFFAVAVLASYGPVGYASSTAENHAYVQSLQQGLTVEGTIVDSNGQPVIGASLILKGDGSIGTVTDIDGNFSLSVPGPGVLVVSAIGYKTVEISVSSSTKGLSIVLEEDNEMLDDVVVIGYGTVKKSDLTGSVSTVRAEDMMKRNPIDIGQGLQGAAAGVQVLRNSGDPRGGTTIRIRGIATVNGSADPLYVVDGVQVGTSIDFLNPGDIESIQILKDASATAIYGSRGANGVIMVTTKKGTKGTARVDASVNYGVGTSSSRLEVGTIQDFVKAIRTTKEHDGGSFTELAWADPSLDSRLNNIDWQDVMTRTALQQNYNLSVSGGNASTQARLSVGYLNNKGIVVASQFDRLTARLNVTHNIKNFIKITGNASYVHGVSQGSGNAYSYAGAIPSMDSLDENGNLVNVPVQYPDGTWGHYNVKGDGDIEKGTDNLYAAAMTRDSRTAFDQIMTNANIDIDIIKGLQFHTVASWNLYLNTSDTYSPVNPRTFITKTTPDSFSLNYGSTYRSGLESWFSYDLAFGKNKLNLMAGYSVNDTRSFSLNGSASSMPAPNIRRIELTKDPSSKNVSGGYGMPERFVSWYGRLNYNFSDRYLLTFTIRRDGSSNFGAGNRWGNFPSTSFAWRASEEEFIKNLGIFDNLKLRAGWGQTGNAGSPTNRSVEQLSSSYTMYYWYNNNAVISAPGLAKLVEVDTNLKWETNEQTNVGVDFGFFKNSLTFSVDYFIRTAKDLLLFKSVRPSTGYDSVYTNSGVIRNKGFEFTLGYNTKFGDDWRINTSFTGSTLKNEAVDVGNDIFESGGIDTGYYWENYSITRNGCPVGSFYGWKVDGIFQSDEEIEEMNRLASQKTGGEQTAYQKGAVPGDWKYVDVNGDGYINDDDRTILGNGTPKFNFGLNINVYYKNFDFSANIYGVLGQKILSYSYARLNTIYNARAGYQNCLKDYMDNAWTPENHSTTHTRLTRSDANHNMRVSDAFIKNGDFVKIGNVQLGYTLPDKLVRSVNIESLRVYFGIDNLVTISGYNKYGNPEIGNSSVLRTGFDGGRYPYPRTYNFGLTLQF